MPTGVITDFNSFLTDDVIKNGLDFTKPTQQNAEGDDFIEIKGLPSGNAFYKNSLGMPIKLRGQPLKVKDILSLNVAKSSGEFEIIDNIIQRRIKGVSVNDLLEMDRLYIMAWLREQSFIRTPLKVNYFKCSECGHQNRDVTISIKDFIIYSLQSGTKDPKFDLPVSQQRVELKYERHGDVKRVINYIKENESFREITDSDAYLFRIASMLKGKSIESGIEFLEKLCPEDFAAINTVVNSMETGITNIAKVKCGKEECQHENLIRIPFSGDFYLPKLQPRMVTEEEEGTVPRTEHSDI